MSLRCAVQLFFASFAEFVANLGWGGHTYTYNEEAQDHEGYSTCICMFRNISLYIYIYMLNPPPPQGLPFFFKLDQTLLF